MNITPECISCIFNQALKIAKELKLDNTKSKEILEIAAKNVPNFDMTKNPPQNATPMYEEIAKHLKVKDIYKKAKIESTINAKEFESECLEMIESSKDKFLTATKIAVAGNVIDLASEVRFDLEKEIKKIVKTEFATDDSKELFEMLKNSKELVYLADNAGEHIFDKIYIQTLLKIFPTLNIYYFVRATPIINDVTKEEAIEAKIDKYADIIDSGVKTPGVVIDMLNPIALKLFKDADCIISKGMGNYECLNEEKEYPLFFLLKVKCSVVANSVGRVIGDMVCKKV